MGFPAVLIIGGLYTGLIPPRELSERERLLLAAHREANNIWASAQLTSLHSCCCAGEERVCVSVVTAVTSRKMLRFEENNQKKMNYFCVEL